MDLSMGLDTYRPQFAEKVSSLRMLFKPFADCQQFFEYVIGAFDRMMFGDVFD